LKYVYIAVWIGVFGWMIGVGVASAEIDERPLEVRVEPAFPQLVWPEWLLGADTGLPRDPRPVVITGAGDGSGRMFVATEYGTIHAFRNDPQVEEMTTFLDIRERVMPFKYRENEEGFLGLAFHPRFKENGELFVYYTAKPTADQPHQSIVSRFRVAEGDPNRADPNSEEVILRIDQPFWNHNGGTVVFGPDGYLYVGLGDGGLANDPHMNGQNLQTLLGSILRIDVDRQEEERPYAIPADNPFVGKRWYARPEIWAYGIRNVWRVTFDRETGTCWGADVGQDTWEEINIIRGGGNYGWNLREGRHPFGPGGFAPNENLIEPIWEYHHDVGKSITGGYVYRGRKVPELQGAYLYADYVTGQHWALWYDAAQNAVTANRSILPKGTPVLTYGEDDQGEVYFTSEQEIFTFGSP
jgi:glucose/arabinose dehydrogenase